MKLVKIAALAAVAAGTLAAGSCCCKGKSAPAPSVPSYVAPSK
jgi:hypothetical protein